MQGREILKIYACSFASDSDAPNITGWIAMNWTGSIYNLLKLYSFVCIQNRMK
jgi:hypothetical protein